MKKNRILLFVLCLGFSFMTFRAQGQAVEQGNFMVDAYYGFPNLTTATLRLIAKASVTDPYVKISGLGPFGGKVQYMITDHIGLGLDVYYASSGIKYQSQTTDSTGSPVIYSYDLKNTRPRFLLRGDFHFGNSDIVDFYGAVGLGYNASKVKFTTNDPLFDFQSFYKIRSSVPVAFRMAFGTKFYFAKFFGAGIELGLGGPLLTVGLSGKF